MVKIKTSKEPLLSVFVEFLDIEEEGGKILWTAITEMISEYVKK